MKRVFEGLLFCVLIPVIIGIIAEPILKGMGVNEDLSKIFAVFWSGMFTGYHLMRLFKKYE